MTGTEEVRTTTAARHTVGRSMGWAVVGIGFGVVTGGLVLGASIEVWALSLGVVLLVLVFWWHRAPADADALPLTRIARGRSHAPGRARVSVRDLTVLRDGAVAVPSLHLTVDAGVVVFADSTGDGSGSLLAALGGRTPIEAAEARVGDLDLTTRRGRAGAARQVAYLGPDARLEGRATVSETVWAATRKGGGASGWPAVAGVLEALHLQAFATEPIGLLPASTRRLVLLATALVREAEVLLLDQPTAGLTEGDADVVRRCLRSVGADRVVMVASTSTADLEALADRVVVLRSGVVVFDGTPASLAAMGGPAPRTTARPVEIALHALAGRRGWPA